MSDFHCIKWDSDDVSVERCIRACVFNGRDGTKPNTICMVCRVGSRNIRENAELARGIVRELKIRVRAVAGKKIGTAATAVKNGAGKKKANGTLPKATGKNNKRRSLH